MVAIKKPSQKEIFDFMKDLVIIVVIVLVVTNFIAMNFQINGQSMYDSYYDKEFIIVDRISYRFSEPQRGDVVVFKPHTSQQKKYFLKRIIGIPGDEVAIEDGIVYLKTSTSGEFKELNEEYLNESNKGYTSIKGATARVEYKVPENSYFVMGDNRKNSTDSRDCFSACIFENSTHFALKSDITGKLWMDLGYFNIRSFSFTHPSLGISTSPRFLDSPKTFTYEL